MLKGGPGSGFHGHVGRPGLRGGSTRGSIPSKVSDKIKILGGSPKDTTLAQSMLDECPRGIENAVSKIVFYADPEKFKDDLVAGLKKNEEEMPPDDFLMGVVGRFDSVERSIEINMLPSNQKSREVFMHEIGHAIIEAAPYDLQRKWAQDWWDRKIDNLTQYSMSSYDEGFAESFMVWKTIDPKTIAAGIIFKNTMNRVEFISDYLPKAPLS